MSASIAVVDGHNDLAWELRERGYDLSADDIATPLPHLQTDLPRLRAGGVRGQFWSVYAPSTIPDPLRATLEQVDAVHALIERYPDDLVLATDPEDLARALEAGPEAPIASMLGAEGGHCIADSLGVLRDLHRLGVRYMTLTHNESNAWADSATGAADHGGLTDFGRDVVREMNRIGMLVDLSHVAPSTMRDALVVSAAPVIFSHSSCLSVCGHVRNVPDDVLADMAERGGTCMITMVPRFVSQRVKAWSDEVEAAATASGIDPLDLTARDAFEATWPHPAPPATLEEVVAHIEHAREVAGIEHIGLGGDYDGAGTMPVGLEDVSTYPRLFDALRARRWSDDDLARLGGRNVLATWRAAEAVSRELRAGAPVDPALRRP